MEMESWAHVSLSVATWRTATGALRRRPFFEVCRSFHFPHVFMTCSINSWVWRFYWSTCPHMIISKIQSFKKKKFNKMKTKKEQLFQSVDLRCSPRSSGNLLVSLRNSQATVVTVTQPACRASWRGKGIGLNESKFLSVSESMSLET